MIELYIPPPPEADKEQAFHYHIATRNFLAFVYRRSLVGESLGDALVGLLHSMHEFRSRGEDNVEDMMDYLDEEGYLDLAEHPDHALACLYWAEFFQLRDTYIRAFAHCAGMSDILFSSGEYQHTSLASKKLIRKARRDTDAKVFHATDLLQDLLDDELSDAHLGIPAETRAHLERFRSFLLSFYSTRLGYYPPRQWDASLLASMRTDFEALYELLVDRAYIASEIMPSTAVGGICTLQLIQSFDARNQYEPLTHPLPLLPQFSHPGSSPDSAWRLSSWLPRSDKIRPEQRFVAHAALIKASNWRENIFRNDLVRAYRVFEEQSIVTPNKADRQEKVSLMDARKVRWILVYSIYQVLRGVTDVPPEVQDGSEAGYHLAIRTADLPPWREKKDLGRLLRSQTDMVKDWKAMGITPDIDYYTLTHPSPTIDRGREAESSPKRSASLGRALSRGSTLRRSMRFFTAPATPPPPSPLKKKPSYQEILVQGYGNGAYIEGSVNRSDSTTTRSDASDSGPESLDSGDTVESIAPTTPAGYTDVEVLPLRPRRRDVVSMMLPASFSPTIPRRPASVIGEPSGGYSNEYTDLVELSRRSIFELTPAIPPRSPSRGNPMAVSQTKEVVVIRSSEENEWDAMAAFMDDEAGSVKMTDADVKPAWEQYADLGGLTEMR